MPQPYKLEEVKQWFGKLTIIDNPRITQHLQSLGKYGDNPVNSTAKKSDTAWHKIFNECLLDLENINNTDKKYREDFERECIKSISELLNKMTKKDFVELFAKVMNDIFTNEKVEEEKKSKLRDELYQEKEKEEELEKIRQNYDTLKPWEQEELNTVRNDFGSGARLDIMIGGSKKKSNKRIRRKRRDSRRNKTRKYKKRN